MRPIVAALLGFAPVVAFAPAFGGLGDRVYLLAATGAVVLAATVGMTLSAWRRLVPAARALVTLAAIALYATVVLAPGEPVLSGPKQLLTAALPLDAAGPPLAAVAAFCGVATVCAVEAALRKGAPLLPLAGPLVFTAAGCAVTASIAEPPTWLAFAIAAVGVALTLHSRRRVLGAAVMSLAVVGAVAAAPALTGFGRETPFDARSLVPQPVRPLVGISPLAQFAAIRSGRLPLSLRIESDARPTRLRYLSMDRFDGEGWTSAARYKRAGHRLPPGQTKGDTKGETNGDTKRETNGDTKGDTQGEAGAAWSVTEHVTVEQPGPLGWLPASGRPTEVSVTGLGVDERTGEVVIPDDQAMPARYTVRSEIPVQDPELLEFATPASPPRERTFTVPADLAARATQIAGGEYGHPALAALAAHFARDGGYAGDDAAQSRPGHGLLHLRQLLQTRHGTAEQYASAFAVLARALGYDTRVVVGFVPREDGSAFRVAGRDIDAWPEVRFTGLGWVAYHPTPGQRTPTEEPPKTLAPQPEQTPSPPQFAPPGEQGAQPGAAPLEQTRWAQAIAPAATALALVALMFAAIPLVKAARRWRRRRGVPNAQVVGAWRDTVDRFAEAGLAIRVSATPAEVALAAAHRFAIAPHDALRLAALHDAAAYGPVPHGPTNAITAWRHAARVRRDLNQTLRFGQRLRAAVSPRPLLRGR